MLRQGIQTVQHESKVKKIRRYRSFKRDAMMR